MATGLMAGALWQTGWQEPKKAANNNEQVLSGIEDRHRYEGSGLFHMCNSVVSSCLVPVFDGLPSRGSGQPSLVREFCFGGMGWGLRTYVTAVPSC